MAKYFTLAELTNSSIAKQFKINNTPPEDAISHLEELMVALDSLREFYGKPIGISSGYRCKALNQKLSSSSPTSVHMIGYAADMYPVKGTFDEFKKVCQDWAKSHSFDQLLIEKNSKGSKWIHLGLYNNSHQQRKQIKWMSVK